jgi:hypothetical protein
MEGHLDTHGVFLYTQWSCDKFFCFRKDSNARQLRGKVETS